MTYHLTFRISCYHDGINASSCHKSYESHLASNHCSSHMREMCVYSNISSHLEFHKKPDYRFWRNKQSLSLRKIVLQCGTWIKIIKTLIKSNQINQFTIYLHMYLWQHNRVVYKFQQKFPKYIFICMGFLSTWAAPLISLWYLFTS